MSANNSTANSNASSQPAAQGTGKQGGILNKVGGVGNIIHGTGNIIRGQIPGAGDPAHGGKAAVVTAGRQEVERGLDRIEGKSTNTSAAGHAPARDWEQGGVSNGTGADIRHPLDTGRSAAATTTAGVTATGTRGHGPAPGQRHDERTQAPATTAPPHERHIAANGSGVQRDTDMRQQGNGTVAGDQGRLDKEAAADWPGAQRDTDVRQQVQGNGRDTGTNIRDKQTHTTADASDPANAVPGGYDPPAASGIPGVQNDTDECQQGNGSVSDDRFKAQQTRTTADTSDPVNTAAGQEQPFGAAPRA